MARIRERKTYSTSSGNTICWDNTHTDDYSGPPHAYTDMYERIVDSTMQRGRRRLDQEVDHDTWNFRIVRDSYTAQTGVSTY